jgi:hypothetical protein
MRSYELLMFSIKGIFSSFTESNLTNVCDMSHALHRVERDLILAVKQGNIYICQPHSLLLAFIPKFTDSFNRVKKKVMQSDSAANSSSLIDCR